MKPKNRGNLEKELKKLKKQAKRQRWINVYLLWENSRI
jgi:hypothetical protein